MKPIYNVDGIEVYQGNCGDVLPTINDVDMVISDPPWQYNGYIIAINKEGKVSPISEAEWFKKMWVWYASWMPLVQNTGVKKGWYFVGWFQFPPFIRIASLIKLPIQHIFTNIGHEFLVYFGPEPLYGTDLTRAEKAFAVTPYSNRKDVDMLKSLIRSSGESPGLKILDPFAGDGGTMVATWKTGNRGVGVEVRKECCELMTGKLKKENETYDKATEKILKELTEKETA